MGDTPHCQPVCLRDVLTSSWGNVMHSAFPCECSAKVQLIQSLADDSRRSVPLCTDARAHARTHDTHTHSQAQKHTRASEHMRRGAWLEEVYEVSAESESQRTCEMILVPTFVTLSNSPFLSFLSADALSYFDLLSSCLYSLFRCVFNTNPAFPCHDYIAESLEMTNKSHLFRLL